MEHFRQITEARKRKHGECGKKTSAIWDVSGDRFALLLTRVLTAQSTNLCSTAGDNKRAFSKKHTQQSCLQFAFVRLNALQKETRVFIEHIALCIIENKGSSLVAWEGFNCKCWIQRADKDTRTGQTPPSWKPETVGGTRIRGQLIFSVKSQSNTANPHCQAGASMQTWIRPHPEHPCPQGTSTQLLLDGKSFVKSFATASQRG